MKPHGPRKPTAAKREMGAGQLGGERTGRFDALIEISFPMVAGIVKTLAEEMNPPSPTVCPDVALVKSYLKSPSERDASLSRDVSAVKSFSMSAELLV